MKPLFTFLLLVLTCIQLPAQEKIKLSAVPPAVVEEFESRFSGAENVTWLRENEQYYGARFSVNGQQVETVYTPQGEWIQTEQDIAYQEMPDDARLYCRSNYPDCQAKAVKKVSTRKYGILYEIKVIGGIQQVGMTFDMHGKLVEKKETTAEETESKEPGVKDKLNKLFKKSE